MKTNLYGLIKVASNTFRAPNTLYKKAGLHAPGQEDAIAALVGSGIGGLAGLLYGNNDETTTSDRIRRIVLGALLGGGGGLAVGQLAPHKYLNATVKPATMWDI